MTRDLDSEGCVALTEPTDIWDHWKGKKGRQRSFFPHTHIHTEYRHTHSQSGLKWPRRNHVHVCVCHPKKLTVSYVRACSCDLLQYLEIECKQRLEVKVREVILCTIFSRIGPRRRRKNEGRNDDEEAEGTQWRISRWWIKERGGTRDKTLCERLSTLFYMC